MTTATVGSPSPTAQQQFWRWLPLGALFIALCAWTLAYQMPFSQIVHVGGDVERQRREDDRPFFAGTANGSEPATPNNLRWWETVTDGYAFRWTRADTTATFSGIGGGRWVVEVLATPGGRSDVGRLVSTWTVGANPSIDLVLPPGAPRRYRILAASAPTGDLALRFQTPSYTPPNDARQLGFVLHEVRVRSVGDSLRPPAWPQLALLTLSLILLYGLARGLAFGQRGALALAGASALMAALLLATSRMALTFFTPALAGLALSCSVLGLAGWWGIRQWATKGARGQVDKGLAYGRTTRFPVSPDSPDLTEQAQPGTIRRFLLQVLALTLLAFALRMGGMLHPHAIYSDSGFNANNLLRVTMGQVFLSAGLPNEAGGGEAPYPPGFYLLSMPAQLFIPAVHADRVLLVQAVTALLDSLLLPVIALILLNAGLGRAAALFGAAAYLLPITALESFAVGELANISGQALAMPFIALLALGVGAVNEPLRRWWVLALLTASLAIGLVAHSGVTLSLGAFTAGAWSVVLVGQLRGRIGAGSFRRLTLVAASALGLVLLIYYSAYVPGLLARDGVGAAAAHVVRSVPLGSLISETGLGVLGIVPPRFRAWSLPIALCLAALGGLGWLWYRRAAQPEAAGLRTVLAAWWLGMLLTQALLLVADQGVRWSLFLYPGLCLSAGALLGAFWARGRWARGAALGLLTWMLTYGTFMWVSHVRDYFHI